MADPIANLRRALRRAGAACDRAIADCYDASKNGNAARARLAAANARYIYLAQQLEVASAGAYRCADDPRLADLVPKRASSGELEERLDAREQAYDREREDAEAERAGVEMEAAGG